MRSEKEIREQIKLISQTKEVAGLLVDNEIAISWLEWVLKDDGWHDARKELPPRNADYLLFSIHGGYQVAEWSGGKWHFEDLWGANGTLAWRELPDSPKFEEGCDVK